MVRSGQISAHLNPSPRGWSCAERPLTPPPPTSGRMACLTLLQTGGPSGAGLRGVSSQGGSGPRAGSGLRAGSPGSLCSGAGSQQEVSPRVRRGGVAPGQEVSDSGVV